MRRTLSAIRKIQALCLILAVVYWAPGFAYAEDTTTHYQTAGGVGGYIGVVPAEIVKGHASDHPERSMHGGAPSKVHEHHLIVALFDESTGARITNAKVAVTVFGPGNTVVYSQSRHPTPRGSKPPVLPQTALEPMQIAGTTTYGGFFQLPAAAVYTIQVIVQRSEKTKPVTLNFVYDNGGDGH